MTEPAKKKKCSPKKSGGKFLLEYDNPVRNSRCRQEFYKMKRTLGVRGNRSTQSVITSDNLDKLLALQKKSVQCGGNSKIYHIKAIKVPKTASPKKRKKLPWEQ